MLLLCARLMTVVDRCGAVEDALSDVARDRRPGARPASVALPICRNYELGKQDNTDCEIDDGRDGTPRPVPYPSTVYDGKQCSAYDHKQKYPWSHCLRKP